MPYIQHVSGLYRFLIFALFLTFTTITNINQYVARVFIFSKIIAYGVYITSKVTYQCYDIWIKGQDQIYLESVLRLVTQALFACLTELLRI